MMEAPTKTCEHCRGLGPAYTFMSGETICPTCLANLGSDPRILRHGVTDLRAELARLTAENEKLRGAHNVDVLDLKEQNITRWRDRDDSYWFARLVQEVGELGSSLVGDHGDPPEHELRQIASIALNWLDKRAAELVQP